MAFGTPTDGGAAYSAAAGTTVAPAYPASIAAKDVLVLIIGQKPSTANSGTVTTPTGWTLRESILAQGAYGTTLGADTGNTNLYFYTKDVVDGTETGNLTVTLGTNNVSWGLIIRVPGGGASSYSVGSADAGRGLAPTSGTPFLSLLAPGATAPNLQSGDMAIWAMCIPTDVLTNGFTNPSISSSGTTFATAVKLEEPDSGTGNDIGGYAAYALATAGSSTATASVTITATGTVTNVRGPIALIRIRDTTQILTPGLFTNTNSFHNPTVTKGAVNLTPARYNNTNTFYTPAITQTGGVQTLVQAARFNNTNTFYTQAVTKRNTLTPARYTNTNTFFTPTITKRNTLTPARYTNTNTFFTPTVGRGAVNLAPARYNNTNVFYSAVITRGANNLAPARYNNTNVFYSASIGRGAVNLAPALYNNTNVFYSATVTRGAVNLAPALYTNTNVFYSPSVTQPAFTQNLLPNLYTNNNAFYAPTAAATYDLEFLDYYDPGYVDTGYTTLGVLNNNTFFAPTSRNVNYISTPLVVDADTFYPATVVKVAYNLSPSRVNNTQTFFPATASIVQFLLPPLVSNQNAFYAAHVAIEQFITAPLVTNTNTIYAVNAGSSYTLSPIRVPSTNAIYTPSVAVGPAFILPSLFSNQNRFYKQSVLWWNIQPIAPETWDGVADTPASWDDLPITVKTWTELYVTETTWDSV